MSLGAAAALTLSIAAVPTPVVAVDDVNTAKLRHRVDVGDILAHERVFQRIANRNDGTRASGTPGYDASARYVADTLRDAGYRVRTQEFEFNFFEELAPGTLEQVSPTPTEYATDTFEYSGTGDVTGVLVPTNDIVIPPTPTPSSSSGCEPSDFPTAPAGPAIALMQRGTCDFVVKVQNAEDAGYEAAVIFNEGQPGRDGPVLGTLGTPVDIPVVDLTFADGAALYAQVQGGDEVVMHVTTSTDNHVETTSNVLGTSKSGNPKKKIVVGAHLDSVLVGPGINDNGSGSSTILQIAEEIAKLKAKPRQQLRFAFWGAEENSLVGSTYYVDQLSDRQLRRHVANLNFDMLGSPNYVRFVYDGDGSSLGIAGPPGSGQIESVFTDYFANQGLASDPTAFDGRSDYGPFIEAGIPAGGLFSGAEVAKTEAQAEVYGGTAGESYDPCYHQACDDITNLSTKALSELGDAAAHATWTLARSRSGFFEDGSFRAGAKAGKAGKAGAARNQAPRFDYKGSHAVR